MRTIDYLALQQSLRLQKTPAATTNAEEQVAREEENGNGHHSTVTAETPPTPPIPPIPPIRLRREQSVEEDVAR